MGGGYAAAHAPQGVLVDTIVAEKWLCEVHEVAVIDSNFPCPSGLTDALMKQTECAVPCVCGAASLFYSCCGG